MRKSRKPIPHMNYLINHQNMKLSKKLEQKLKQEGIQKWKYWYDVFSMDVNYPVGINKEQREVIAHNLALQVIWCDSHNI